MSQFKKNFTPLTELVNIKTQKHVYKISNHKFVIDSKYSEN